MNEFCGPPRSKESMQSPFGSASQYESFTGGSCSALRRALLEERINITIIPQNKTMKTAVTVMTFLRVVHSYDFFNIPKFYQRGKSFIFSDLYLFVVHPNTHFISVLNTWNRHGDHFQQGWILEVTQLCLRMRVIYPAIVLDFLEDDPAA